MNHSGACAIVLAALVVAAGTTACGDDASAPDASAPDSSITDGGDAARMDAAGPDSSASDASGTDVSMGSDATTDADPVTCDHPVCTALPQCGCAPSEACYLDSTTEDSACLPAGTTGASERCTDDNDCMPGVRCVEFADDRRVCQTACVDDGDCSAGATCLPLHDDAGDVLVGVSSCSVPCDPITNAGCGVNTTCDIYAYGAPKGTVTLCSPAGSIGSRGDCSGDLFGCEQGTICVTVGPASRCAGFCRLAMGDADCPGAACREPEDPLVVGGTMYGICI
jgi:hypothetical protein